MKRLCLITLLPVALLAMVSGCDNFAFGKSAVTTKWISKRANLGIIMKQSGSKYDGVLYLLGDNAAEIAKAMDADFNVFEGAMFLSYGVPHADGKTMLFPIKTNTMMQVPSASKIVEKNMEYVEIDLDLERDYLLGKWRKGKKKPSMKRKFVRYVGPGGETQG